MNEESVFLLKMLSGFIRGEAPGEFVGDGKKLAQLAEIHKVAGIAGYMLRKYPQPAAAEVSPFLWQCCLDSILTFTGRNEHMKELNSLFSAEGIDMVLFKGYVLKDLYPVPELRSFYDIDFLIHSSDRQRADDLMVKKGYARKTDWEPVYSYYKGNEFYEIHTDIMEVSVSDTADQNEYFRNIWNYTFKTGEHTYQILPEYHLLYLLTHIAKHINNSGAGIRMYMDIAVFLRHYGNTLSTKIVECELEKLGLSKFAGTVFALIERFFGEKSPFNLPEPEQSVLDGFAEYTVSGGIFGKYGRDPGLLTVNKRNKNRKKSSKILAFIKELFPSVKNMQKKYTYLKKFPWLIVFAWFHRFFVTRKEFKMHFRELTGIFKSKPAEIEGLKKLIKDIGL